MSNAAIINIAQKIVKQVQPEKIILFGSFAWGTPGPDSDVDLLVIKETDNPRAVAREIDDALFPRPCPIDVIVYRPDQVEERRQRDDMFITDILTNGKVLYAR